MPIRSDDPSPISCGPNILDIQETAKYTPRHKKEVLINNISSVSYYSSRHISAVEFKFSDASVYESAKEKMMGENLIRKAFESAGIIEKNKSFTINYSENESALTFRLYLEG